MARRSRKSGAEEWIDLLATLPWWACLVIALIGYGVAHHVAVGALPTFAGKPGELGSLMAATWLHGVALAAQYIVPFLCVVAAFVSFSRRQRRAVLFESVAASNESAALDAISWSAFEELVGEAFRRRGYRVEERGGPSPDGGVDLVLRRDGKKFFVQCKQWKAYRVGVDVVRQLNGVIAAHGAQGGFVITSGRFTDEAAAFARLASIELVDGVALHALIRDARPVAVVSKDRAGDEDTDRVGEPVALPRDGADRRIPACPGCGAAMVRRTARRGAQAGKDFWGCTGFPACRGTRSVESVR